MALSIPDVIYREPYICSSSPAEHGVNTAHISEIKPTVWEETERERWEVRERERERKRERVGVGHSFLLTLQMHMVNREQSEREMKREKCREGESLQRQPYR